MTFTHKDIIVNSLDIEHILDVWGNETEGHGDYDTEKPQDDGLYTVDMRFTLTEDGKKRLFNDLPLLTDSIIIAGESIPTSELSGYDVNDLDFGGMYISFDVTKDGRVTMDMDGFVPMINGSGDYISVDPMSLCAVEDAFYEFAGGRDAFRDHILKECGLHYGITKDHLRLPIPQEKKIYEINFEALIDEAVGNLSDKRISEIFPEVSLDDISHQRWAEGLVQHIEINGDMCELYLGLYCEGEDYKDQMIDSPWTLEAILGDDVVYCKSVERNEKEKENSMLSDERCKEILKDWGFPSGELVDYLKENEKEVQMVLDNQGDMMDLDCILAIENALERKISYEEYHTINKTCIFDDMGLFNVEAKDAELLKRILDNPDLSSEEWKFILAEEETGKTKNKPEPPSPVDFRLDEFKNVTVDMGTFTVDVSLQQNGKFDVYIAHEGNSGTHYTDVSADQIGSLVAEEIECLAEGYQNEFNKIPDDMEDKEI